MIIAEFGTGQVFLSMLYFFLFFIWIWMLIAIFADIFRSPDLSGWGKALWSLFVIVLPFLGVFTYLIARGRKMSEHAADQAMAEEAAFRRAVQQAAATTPQSDVDQLTKLESLHTSGVIDDAEFDRMKAKVVAS